MDRSREGKRRQGEVKKGGREEGKETGREGGRVEREAFSSGITLPTPNYSHSIL